jgi:DDE domain
LVKVLKVNFDQARANPLTGISRHQLHTLTAAHRQVMPSVEHRTSKYLNNRAENSHQTTRQWERAMKRFTSPGHAQRFLSAFSGISPHFRPRRHRLTAHAYRREMTERFTVWTRHRLPRSRLTAANPQASPCPAPAHLKVIRPAHRK